MSFLDKTGLQHLWGKIKAKIGTGTLNTTNKTIIPAINELNNGLTALSDNVGSFVWKEFYLSSGTTHTFRSTGGTRFANITTGTSVSVQGIILGAISNNNETLTQSTLTTSTSYGVTCSFSNGVISFKNNSTSYVTCKMIMMSGSLT